MNKIDLHLHTNYSDGIFSPKEVLELAAKNEYTIISITDHDTLDGYRAAQEINHKYDLKILPGVEVSSYYKNRDVHILAYDIAPDDQEFNELLEYIQKSRYIRAERIIENLEKLGISVDFERVKALAGKNVLIARPHIARAMVENGTCKSTQEAFDNYIGNESPAYVLKKTPTVDEIIESIHRAGGVAVLAHPHTLFNDSYIYDFVEMDLDGLEVFYAKYDEHTVDHYDEIAQKNNLIRTGGSDFHGMLNDFNYFGDRSAPHYVVEEIKYRAKRYKY
ncbi:MAG: PHP domain-containing protein [Candidatus Cloacimonetes bacterium]|nr:PHP domain-containing protein [Candidatus Cloacimonadota bacterium]